MTKFWRVKSHPNYCLPKLLLILHVKTPSTFIFWWCDWCSIVLRPSFPLFSYVGFFITLIIIIHGKSSTMWEKLSCPKPEHVTGTVGEVTVSLAFSRYITAIHIHQEIRTHVIHMHKAVLSQNIIYVFQKIIIPFIKREL